MKNMKTIEWMGAALVCLTLAAAAQSEQAKAAGEQIGASVSAITERGLHHRVWSSITWETNRLGHPVAKTNSFTELATGMYFRDASGNWAESKEEFQLAGGRAVARMGAHKVNLPANLNTAGGIELEMPDGRFCEATCWA